MNEATPTETADAAVQLELEQPQPGSTIHVAESLVGLGWALADVPITAIAVDLDGQYLCDATTGLPRNDVGELHVDHPGSARAGFTFVTRLPPLRSGPAELRLRVRTEAGEHAYTVPVEIIGGTDATAPAIAAATQAAPLPDAPGDLEPIRLELEEARIDGAGGLHVRGWALAARDVRSVEVFFGQRSLGFADTALSRADVASAFPAYPNAPMAGFALHVALTPEQIGAESVTVVATDGAGETLSATRTATGNLGA